MNKDNIKWFVGGILVAITLYMWTIGSSEGSYELNQWDAPMYNGN